MRKVITCVVCFLTGFGIGAAMIVLRPVPKIVSFEYAVVQKDIYLDWLGINTPLDIGNNGKIVNTYKPYMHGVIEIGSIVSVGPIEADKWRKFQVSGVVNSESIKVVSKTVGYSWGSLAGITVKDISLDNIGAIVDRAFGVVREGSVCTTGNISKGGRVSFGISGWINERDVRVIGDWKALVKVVGPVSGVGNQKRRWEKVT